MKKTLSIILPIVMLFSIATTSTLSVYAGGWADMANKIEFNNTYTEMGMESDYHSLPPYSNWDYIYYDSFLFDVPVKSNIKLHVESKERNYFEFSAGDGYQTKFVVYKYTDIDNRIIELCPSLNFSSGRGVYYSDFSFLLEKGTYYLVAEYRSPSQFNDYYSFNMKLNPSISAPSNFKVSTRNTNSLKLSWGKVANVSGYQIQKKSGDTYKTITNTNSTSVTVKNLKSATAYKFRVRAYKTVDGEKYYGSWKYLTTPTKPAKAEIKAPSTNSKHQIIAKWKKVDRASGYQVQYCKNSSCSNVIAKKTVSGGSKTSYTGNNFTKGKTYYVRVRAYKTVDGTKYYGAWSNVKSIKCK